MNDTERQADQVLHRTISTFQLGCLIYAALKMGLIERLRDGPVEAATLAWESDLDNAALTSYLRYLVREDVLAEPSPNAFGLGSVGQVLTIESGGEWVLFELEAFRNISRTLQTGREAAGERIFDYLSSRPYAEAAYQRNIVALDSGGNEAIAAAYQLCDERVVEMGGGGGGLVAAIVRHHPGVTPVLVERSVALEGAHRYLESEGLLDRVELVEGSIFGHLPTDGEVYILKWILPDWTDEEIERVFTNCRAAMPDGAHLHVIEILAVDGPEDITAVLDLNVRAIAGGQVYTEQAVRRLLQRAGFSGIRTMTTAGPFTLIEGVA